MAFKVNNYVKTGALDGLAGAVNVTGIKIPSLHSS